MRGRITALVAAVAAAAGAASAARWARGRKGHHDIDLEVSADSSTRTEPGRATTVPDEPPTEAGHDDLTAIKGLGKVKAAKLAEAGITRYAQIAAWTDDDVVAEMGLRFNTSPGQIKREDWVGQAKTLAGQ
jgi:predicted flap endonuclease-1-like 5' DNA nuclease